MLSGFRAGVACAREDSSVRAGLAAVIERVFEVGGDVSASAYRFTLRH
jgi:hypothetical protein